MAEPDNLVLKRLRAIRGELAKMANLMDATRTELRETMFGAE